MKITLLAALLLISVATPLKAQEVSFPPTEAAYLAEYEALAATKPSSERLLRTVRKYPQTTITSAKAFCMTLRRLSNEQLRRVENTDLEGETGNSLQYAKDRISIEKVLAPKYFCPDMAKKATSF